MFNLGSNPSISDCHYDDELLKMCSKIVNMVYGRMPMVGDVDILEYAYCASIAMFDTCGINRLKRYAYLTTYMAVLGMRSLNRGRIQRFLDDDDLMLCPFDSTEIVTCMRYLDETYDEFKLDELIHNFMTPGQIRQFGNVLVNSDEADMWAGILQGNYPSIIDLNHIIDVYFAFQKGYPVWQMLNYNIYNNELSHENDGGNGVYQDMDAISSDMMAVAV